MTKPLIGLTCGDINGIGPEIVLKTLADSRILEFCTPVVFGSAKLFSHYRKSLPDANVTFTTVRDWSKVSPRSVNLFSAWEEEAPVTPGELTEAGGKYAVLSLLAAADALKGGHIQGLVTAPIHKKNVQSDDFRFTGHTPFLQVLDGADDVLMLLYTESLRVALVTEHLPLNEVTRHINRETLRSKLRLLQGSLRRDFGIDKPRIAVLGLNPHAGDEGLIGQEEETILRPAIKEAKRDMTVYGPYSADAFFARHQYRQFDAVLALYHDQGLIPFKTLAGGEGVNFSAGLSFVRTSPDHGTAFDIAGKGIADATSFVTALFECVDILRRRKEYEERTRNPLRKVTAQVLKNAKDEAIDETIDP